MKKELIVSLVRHFTLPAVFLSVILFVQSCHEDNNLNDNNAIKHELPIIEDNPKAGGFPLIKKQVPYVRMEMPADPQKLIFDENKKDVAISAIKDTVVVFLEGGPKHEVGYDYVKMIKEEINSKGFINHTVVGLRQAHSTNPTVFGSGSSFTSANAEEVNNQTLNVTEKIIKWLKSNNKTVYIFGHSNGSFIVQNYMTSGKINPAGYIISATRIKPIKAFTDNYPKNIDASFTKGTTVVTKDVPANELPYFNVMTKLQLNHIKNYITLLVGNNMLSKTFYSLAEHDEAVGQIEQDEKNFIITNKIPNIFIPNGEHGEAALGITPALTFFRK
ncbi:hypothetical protein F3J23_06870 [Chryseobacterium sp. Tr-659]|uniref:hypothetical protein n=1 Tax=Chryseobacterium sp. Tr-659 TaxID=2608340 RepID=UPI00141E7B02|nr:hypothetical protein [Chryseobacterium sp. Tr-659]NIF05162.1 hypothetical protein [Chryseobacterium sp. Tr-659]